MTRIRTYSLRIAIYALLGSGVVLLRAEPPARPGSEPVVTAPVVADTVVADTVVAGPVVTVRLYSMEPEANPHLPRAIEEAERVFDRAGLGVRWIGCVEGESRDPACDTAPGRRDIRLRVLPGKGGPELDGALGYALALNQGDGVYANVLFGAVTEVRRGTMVSTAQVLGHVIAHEIGHLLLGTVHHSRTGLMSATWQHEELLSIGRRELRFSAEQTHRIREGARARILADAEDSTVRRCQAAIACGPRVRGLEFGL